MKRLDCLAQTAEGKNTTLVQSKTNITFLLTEGQVENNVNHSCPLKMVGGLPLHWYKQRVHCLVILKVF